MRRFLRLGRCPKRHAGIFFVELQRGYAMSSARRPEGHNAAHHGDKTVAHCDCDECSERFNLWCKKKEKAGKVVCEVKSKTICHYECVYKRTDKLEWGWEREFKHKKHKIDPVNPPENCEDCDKDPYRNHKKIQTLAEAASSPDGHDEFTDEEYMKKCDCTECSDRHKLWCKKFEGKPEICCEKHCKTIRFYHCKQKVQTIKKYGWAQKFHKSWHPHEPSPAPEHCEDCKKN